MTGLKCVPRLTGLEPIADICIITEGYVWSMEKKKGFCQFLLSLHC